MLWVVQLRNADTQLEPFTFTVHTVLRPNFGHQVCEPNLAGLDRRTPFSGGETGGGPIAPPFGLGGCAVMPSGGSRWRRSSTASDFFDEGSGTLIHLMYVKVTGATDSVSVCA